MIQSGEIAKDLRDTFLVLLRVIDNEKRAGSFEIKGLRFLQVDKTGRPIMMNLQMVSKFSSQPAFANPALTGDKLNGNRTRLLNKSTQKVDIEKAASILQQLEDNQ